MKAVTDDALNKSFAMNTRSLTLAILTLVFTGMAWSAGDARKPLDEEALRGFLEGQYDLIGRRPDSAKTYTGRVTLRVKGNTLQAVRTIDGQTQTATAKFDTVAGSDRIPVLRMHFTFEGVEYDATYLWQTDPDNYSRLTGHLYRPNHRTKSPGLEALFPIH
jgi:hypothetical protein